MAWNKKEEVKNDEEVKELYSEDEYKNFKEAMRDFKGNKKINGVLASGFEQYLHSLKVITLSSEVNRYKVHDPAGHTKLAKMNARYEEGQYHNDQRMFKAFPEKREELVKKLEEMRKGFLQKTSI